MDTHVRLISGATTFVVFGPIISGWMVHISVIDAGVQLKQSKVHMGLKDSHGNTKYFSQTADFIRGMNYGFQ